MDDILKRLRDQSKGDRNSSPLSNIFGKRGKEEEEEKLEEDEMNITHYGKESGDTGVFQGVDLDNASPNTAKIGGEGVRELRGDDLKITPASPRLEDTSVTEIDLERPVSPVQGGPKPKSITLNTKDDKKAKYLRLVVALAEGEYYDQAIEALNELRSLSA
jgi:hypothetical protein